MFRLLYCRRSQLGGLYLVVVFLWQNGTMFTNGTHNAFILFVIAKKSFDGKEFEALLIKFTPVVYD